MRILSRTTVTLAALLLLLVAAGPAALAQESTADIQIDSPVRGIEIDRARERADLDVVLVNTADERRIVRFVLEDVPEGWDVGVWSRFFDYRIEELAVEPSAADPNRIQQVSLSVRPQYPDPGEYSFTLRVVSADGEVEYESAMYTLAVTEGVAEEIGDVSVRAELPVLQGAPGEALRFEVLVEHDTEEEGSFSFVADAPPGWDVTFREFFGEQREISAVTVAPEVSERIAVDVQVPMAAESGEYEIPVSVTSELGNAGVTLQANIVGEGDLLLGTREGQQAHAEGEAGRQVATTLMLVNPGTAALSDVMLEAEAPEGWAVDFGFPDNRVSEVPAQHEMELPVLITPAAAASSGDYLITVRAMQGQASAATDVRMTVTEAGMWGWLGLVLAVLVVGGMIGLFLRLGRR